MNSLSPYISMSQEKSLGGNPLKGLLTDESKILRITTSFNFMCKTRKS